MKYYLSKAKSSSNLCFHIKIRLAVLLTSLVLFFACGDHAADEKRKYGETVPITAKEQNPLEQALQILNLDGADLVFPQYQEDDYHLAARLPLIDHALSSPSHLHDWADTTSASLQAAATEGIFDVLASMIKTLNGGTSYYNPQDAINIDPGGFADAYQYLCGQYNTAADNQVLTKISTAGFSVSFDRQLAHLLRALTRASVLVQDAFAALTPAESEYLSQRPERYFFPEGAMFNFLTAPTHIPHKILTIARKIDYVKLYAASLVLIDGIDKFTHYIKTNHWSAYFQDGKKRAGVILSIPSPLGNIVITGQDDGQHSTGGALIIDLGGNDHYRGSVAVGNQVPGLVAVTIDAGGNDTYDAGSSRYAQGFGCLSVGVLVDLGGNDRYLAGSMAQGSGMFGVGVLADYNGNDYYRMGMLGQGFGLFGLGVLLDTAGGDKYIINALGQGAGSTMGFGVLCDTSGNDKYLADRDKKRGWLLPDDLSHVQGAGLSIRSPAWHRNFSFYGGIGFLTDGDGNDFYYASHGNCMGSSYFMSVGALVDQSGNDTYWPDNGWGIASAVHLTGAVLIDRSGSDRYYGKIHTGGAASDRSIAILADYAGNDTYGPDETFVRQLLAQRMPQQFETLSETEKKQKILENMARASYAVSMKPKSLGLLIDYRGDDRYMASPVERKESFGGIVPPAEPQSWSHAILLDLGGADFYSKKERKNNHYYKYLNHGICYDSDYSGNQLLTKTPLSIDAKRQTPVEPVPATTKADRNSLGLSALFDADLFVRFSGIGKILRSDSAVVAQLFKILNTSTNTELNRDIIEILDTLNLTGKLEPRYFKQFAALLESNDSFVQVYAARILADRNVTAALPGLIRVSRHENKTVRKQVIRAMGQIGSTTFIEPLTATVLNDSCRECRDAAVIALTRFISGAAATDPTHYPTILETLTKGLEDPDESVRTSAAQGLRYFGKAPTVRQALQKMLEDDSIYVQRAAAKSLIMNNDKAAIPRLIATLTFPSIDTFNYYDHEIVKDLAFYCGIDFPENERYAYATWNKWWQKNGTGMNLEQNLKIMQAIENAFSAAREDKGIAVFERLMAKHPDNIVIRKRYIRFCNEWINMRLLTRANVSKEIFERCLRLQQKLAELEPDSAERWVRLAYFNYRLNQFKNAVVAMQTALQIAPDNLTNRQTLNHYRNLMQKKNN